MSVAEILVRASGDADLLSIDRTEDLFILVCMQFCSLGYPQDCSSKFTEPYRNIFELSKQFFLPGN